MSKNEDIVADIMISEKNHKSDKTSNIKSFLYRDRVAKFDVSLPATSLFSGGGISDLGYELAGFEFIVQVEKDKNRASLCAKNFPDSEIVVGELDETWEIVVQKYVEKRPNDRLALLSVTPPCQGMSSSNSGRGKVSEAKTSDERNLLLLNSIPVINELKPLIVVVENVPSVLSRVVHYDGTEDKLVEVFKSKAGKDYSFFSELVQMADYGVAQDRRRAILVAVHVDVLSADILETKNLSPFPQPSHERTPLNNEYLPWITLEEWFREMNYQMLDTSSPETARFEEDPLHCVPHYEGDRYLMVAEIPPMKGQSAYRNSRCHECKRENVPEGQVYCPYCGALMRNRPYIKEKNGGYRLIKGFKSSYRRMYPDRPAPTVTTASSHIGSDYKIHPWENRVLSVRECADLQSIPRFYDWSWALITRHLYVARQVIGEALPPWFTYQHGLVLRTILEGNENS